MLIILLLCISIIGLFINMKHAIYLLKKNTLSRKRRHAEDYIIPDETLPTVGTVAPLNVCSLEDPTPCSKFYNCQSHPHQLHIYNDTFERIRTLPPNNEGDGYCVPHKKRKCNPYTGDSMIIKLGAQYETICHCKYPHLVTKSTLFDDCNLDVACRPGRLMTLGDINYNPFIQGTCLCPEEYIARHDAVIGPVCQRSTFGDEMTRFCSGGKKTLMLDKYVCQCPQGYMKIQPIGPPFVKRPFYNHLTTTICIKNPCSWSASFPNRFLTHSYKIPAHNMCRCNHLVGSFPIHSSQSILNSTWNACQTFDEVANYDSISYGCHFYGPHDAPSFRSCFYLYKLKFAKMVLGKKGSYVKVYDTSNWIDHIVPYSYFTDRMEKHAKAENRRIRGTYGIRGHYRFDDSVDAENLSDCKAQYRHKDKWGSVTGICYFNNQIYLSPSYAQDNNINTFLVTNTSEIYATTYNGHNVISGTSKLEPIITFHRFKDVPPPTTFPLDMITS